MMFHLVPPAGTPTSFTDLIRMTRLRFSSKKDSDSLEHQFRSTMNIRRCFAFNSGRSAMTCLLKAIASEIPPGRDEVIIPAYTCFSVPASVIRAGLKVRLVDVSLVDLDFDHAQLERADLSRVAAIVSCNLFGIPGDILRLKSIVQSKSIAIIDDAAQAMGTMVGNTACGCRGDAGIFSLGRGKNLSTYSGGLIVTSDDALAAEIDRNVAGLPTSGPVGETIQSAKITLTSMLLHPGVYWIPDSLPFLGLGKTVFDTDFEIAGLPVLQNCLGQVLVGRLEALNKARAEIADSIAAAIRTSSSFEIPGYREGRSLSYLRLPVLAKDRRHRDAVIVRMQKTGIKASIMYPSTIAQIDGISGHIRDAAPLYPHATQIVERLFTLPTHGYVRPRDVERMIQCLRETA